MSIPRVVCVMLANGRRDMVQRAVRSFHAQTYPAKTLYILDSGAEATGIADADNVLIDRSPQPGMPIGALRNLANRLSASLCPDAEIIAHWDSDDWSHPARLAEQVLMLRTWADLSPAVEVVGYRDVLFYDARKPEGCGAAGALARGQQDSGEAWRYSSPNPKYSIGSSFCYWRRTWEKTPFPDIKTGEDCVWLMRVRNTIGVTGLADAPRMVCAIHGENTTAKIVPGQPEWSRTPVWDAYCRERMAP